jgi:superfamily II DNA or RNA helicase
MSDFLLGGPIDPETGGRIADQHTVYDASDLTTHGVIVGMTGSGKTGLGVIFLEEALRAGVPTLILDPNGDIVELWDDRSEDIEPITIRLEKNDITVSDTMLAWIPRP